MHFLRRVIADYSAGGGITISRGQGATRSTRRNNKR